MKLFDALRLSGTPCLAISGAGGKTSLMFHLAKELKQTHRQILLTTTTHLSPEQAATADHHFIVSSVSDFEKLQLQNIQGIIAVTGLLSEDKRLAGLPPDVLNVIHDNTQSRQVPMLVEADGARRLPLKAPAVHEPAIPDFVELVVVVAGMAGLGRRLGGDTVHRPEHFARLSGLEPGQEITAEALSRVLAHPQGGLKNIPPQARKVLLLNQADTPDLQASAGSVARQVQHAYHGVVVASLAPGGEAATPAPARVYAVHEPVAGILLAAGGSRRLGQPKQLLEWQGQPLVRQVAQTAMQAGLSPLVVVVGAHAAEVEAALSGMNLRIANNERWQEGQSSSIKAGLRRLPVQVGAAIFLLADQPFVSPELVRALVEAHSLSLADIVAPLVDGQRGNPVLFDRCTFPDLLDLAGDVGGRGIFSKHPVEWLPWHDARLLLDIDTPQDVEHLRKGDRGDE